MPSQRDLVISASVLYREASGRTIGPETQITSKNVAKYAPAAKTITEGSAALTKLGSKSES